MAGFASAHAVRCPCMRLPAPRQALLQAPHPWLAPTAQQLLPPALVTWQDCRPLPGGWAPLPAWASQPLQLPKEQSPPALAGLLLLLLGAAWSALVRAVPWWAAWCWQFWAPGLPVGWLVLQALVRQQGCRFLPHNMPP